MTTTPPTTTSPTLEEAREWRALGPERMHLRVALGGAPLEVVDRLYAHGVRVATLWVLEWLPAVDVCWVDGADTAERHALRTQLVADSRASSEALALLDDWLTRRPSAQLLAAAWFAIAVRLEVLDDDARAEAAARVLARCEAAGRAAGAGFGVGPLSAGERRCIEGLRVRLGAPQGLHVLDTSTPPAAVRGH